MARATPYHGWTTLSGTWRRPANTMSDLATFGKEHISTGIGRQTSHVFEEGQGSYVTTSDGTKLLDFTSYVRHAHSAASAS